MKITLVKKILADGSACKKCAEVEAKMHQADQLKFIDRVVLADETDPKSEGMLLAGKYNIDRAPFFIVESESAPAKIYTVYYRFVKEILNGQMTEEQELREIQDNHPDLDFI